MSYNFSFTVPIVRDLQTIERTRETVRMTVLPPAVAAHLRQQARIRSTHFSTRIEGNRLTLDEAAQVIQGEGSFPGRGRDVSEVERYYLALQQTETWAAGRQSITEERIHKLHALLYRGKRARPTLYRDGQNVIRDASDGLVYLPPEAKDLPALMLELVTWINEHEADLPVPIVAGMAHYQFVTIHPFYDGNGRTARMLATWILYRGGYDLGHFYALEEFYAQDLGGYYEALVTHPHHNYYEGRAEADVTTWLAYFLRGMATIFDQVATEVLAQGQQDTLFEDPLLHQLDRRARQVLGLFLTQETIRSREVAQLLGLSQRQTRDLLQQWVRQGWLEIADPSRRARRYRLVEKYQRLVA